VYELAGQQMSTKYWVVLVTGSTGIGSVSAKLMPPPTIAALVLTRDVAEGLFAYKLGADKEEHGVDIGADYDSSNGCRYRKRHLSIRRSSWIDWARSSTAWCSAEFVGVVEDENQFLVVGCE